MFINIISATEISSASAFACSCTRKSHIPAAAPICLAFRISVRWPIYIINSVDKTKFLYTTSPPTQHHSFFRNYPFILFVEHPDLHPQVMISVQLSGTRARVISLGTSFPSSDLVHPMVSGSGRVGLVCGLVSIPLLESAP